MKKLLNAVAVLLLAFAAQAEVKLDPVFTSNMVLQQQRPIRFFGTADPGSEVKVEFNGKTVTAKAGGQGQWTAEFPAMKAGSTAYTVKVSDGKNKIELQDVLIGEVWFCSGQSNMQMPVGQKYSRGWSALNCEQEVANAKYPEIRYAFQRLVQSHLKELPASYGAGQGWVKCSPETAYYFSAAAYFFGRQLHQELKVPVGLINASWGGTRIETWISDAGYKTFGPASDFQTLERFRMDDEAKKKYEEAESKRFSEGVREWHKLFAAAGAEAKAKAQGWAAADLDDSSWKKASTAGKNGKYIVRWLRNHFKLPAGYKGKKVTLAIPKPGEKVDVYLNGTRVAGWEADVPESEKKVRVDLAPDRFNQNGDNVLAIRAEYYHNGGWWSQINNILRDTRLNWIRLNKNWKMEDEFACTSAQTGKRVAPPSVNYPYYSQQFYSNLYNGMTAAWTRLPVRGVIWYQGCSNNGSDHYYPLHKTLIADWRARWNQPEMPFLIVQLAGYEPARAKNWQTSDPNKPSGYALTRDIQQQMLKIPNVGLACAIDIGEADCIHPGNKQDVGKRLALEALRIAYGKNIISRGPLFDHATPEKGAIRVFFKYADNGLKTSDGKAPGAFAVAGADGKFVWAEAKIDGKTVVVSSPEVKEPKFVRYAYAGYRGDCNLQNTEGLPAYPFRSDAYNYAAVK